MTYSQGQLTALDWNLERSVYSAYFPPPPPVQDMLPPLMLLPLKNHSGRHALLRSDKLYMVSQTGSSLLKNLWHSGLLFSTIILLLLSGLSVYVIMGYYHARRFHLQQTGRTADSLPSMEVIQAIAHRIKNSIAKVIWSAEKIKRSVQKKSEIDYSRLSGLLAENAKIMRRQSDNILKLVQIQEPKFQKKALKPLLGELVRHYRGIVDEHIDIQLDMDEDITVYLDEELFKEAMVNLLDNAVDAMPGGGTLRLAALQVVSPEHPGIRSALIEVEDSGHGIDEKDLAHVFTPFYSGKERGSGIGLTICKNIIETHGGTIELHSFKELGTRIAIHVPVKQKKWFP